MDLIRIATRGSLLAMAQSRMVARLIELAHPGLRAELFPISTRGDRTPGRLTEIGGKGLFTAELEEALRDGRMHLAVHSAKDLPLELPGDMTLAACPARGDARDVLVSREGGGFDSLSAAARVGTSSLRRAAQALALRGDVQITPLRGNVETRVRKVLEGELDAAIVAAAGLERSGLAAEHRERIFALAVERFVPAAGQGVLALEALTEALEVRRLLEPLNDPAAQQALLAERFIARRLSADCNSPVGVHVFPQADGWAAAGMVACPTDLSRMVRVGVQGHSSAEVAAASLLEELESRHARRLLGNE